MQFLVSHHQGSQRIGSNGVKISVSFSVRSVRNLVFTLVLVRDASFQAMPENRPWHFFFRPFCPQSTVEPRYNEVLGTMKITLLYQGSHYIRVKNKEI